MTNEEAIRRITEHNRINQRREPRSVYITEALHMAVVALEKQIPKRPIKRSFIVGCKEATPLNGCPTCKEILHRIGNCCDCGQKIDWSDETREGEATNLAEETLTSEDFICSWCGASTNDMNALSKPITYCFNCGARIKRVRRDTEWKL